MSRVISLNSPRKQRDQHRRTIAEALRRLTQKSRIDDEAKDLAALIVFALRDIADGIEQTTSAWEKRNYYLKADRFRMEWEWVGRAAAELARLIRAEQWHLIPPVLGALLPRFSDVTVNKMVRPPSLWRGCYQRLLDEG